MLCRSIEEGDDDNNTLGSIYSTNVGGTVIEEMSETNNFNQT